jgi:hypothetical protein
MSLSLWGRRQCAIEMRHFWPDDRAGLEIFVTALTSFRLVDRKRFLSPVSQGPNAEGCAIQATRRAVRHTGEEAVHEFNGCRAARRSSARRIALCLRSVIG